MPTSPLVAPEPQRVARAPRRGERLFTWLILGLLLAVISPVIFWDIGVPQVIDEREAATVAISVQSFRQHHVRPAANASPLERLVPMLHGRPLWQPPPAAHWHQQLAFLWLSPEAKVERYVLAARVASALMGLVALAGVFWAGACIGQLRTAAFATIVCAANPTFIYHARLAEPTIYYVAWGSVGIAAALWALRPLRPAPSVLRQAIGWAICGLSLGVAALCVGPGALFAVAGPVLVITFLCPGRLAHLMGLVAAVILAALLVLPWAAFAQQQDPAAWPLNLALWLPAHWFNPVTLFEAAWERAPVVFIALLPWCLWLVGAMLQPFSTSSAGVRLRLFIGWSWFLLAFLISMGASDHGEVPTLIAVIPAGAILVAQVFHQYANLASEGRFPRVWRVLRWPHIIFLTALAIAAPVVLVYQSELLARRIIPLELFANPGWFYAVVLCVLLLLIIGLSIRWSLKEHPAQALFAWAGFVGLLVLGMSIPLVRGPAARSEIVDDAAKLTAAVGQNPVVWLPPTAIGDNTTPDPILSLYADRELPRIMATQLPEVAASGAPGTSLFVLTAHEAVAPAGLERVLTLPASRHVLHRYIAAKPATKAE